MCAYQVNEISLEIQHLMSHLTWDVRRGAYVRGDVVCILITTERTPDGAFDVLITVRPLAGGDASALVGMPLTLRRTHDENLTWYGRLNQKGQMLFCNLALGVYQAPIVPGLQFARLGQRAIESTMSPLPSLDRGLAAKGERWQSIYQNASGSLTATLWEQETGGIEIDFEVKERVHDGMIVAFRWNPHLRDIEQLLLAPLMWSERVQACVAQVSIAEAPRVIDGMAISEQPVLLETLVDLPVDVFRRSVAQSARAQTRRAWQRLAEEQSRALSPEVREAISRALAEFNE